MRVPFAVPSAREFDILFGGESFVRRGGGYEDINIFHSPLYRQRGSGILSVIGHLVRKSIPFIRRLIMPAAAAMTSDVLTDYSNGSSMKAALKKRGIETLKKVGQQIIKGGAKKKQNKKIKRLTGVKRTKKRNKCKAIEDDVFAKHMP